MPTPRRQRDADREPERAEEARPAPDAGDGDGTGANALELGALKSRREQYLIAHQANELLPQGVEPLDLSALEQSLRDDEEIEFKRTIRPLGVLAAFATNTAGAQDVLVASMPPERAKALDGLEQLVVERDELVAIYAPAVADPVALVDPGTLAPASEEFNPTIVVKGADGSPVPGATVYVFGRLFPYQGTTGADGKVAITLFNETADTVKSIYVKPKTDYWSMQLPRPQLRDDAENVVTLPPLGTESDGFPEKQVLGWGQLAMGLEDVPSDFRGRGVRVGVVDSGAAGAHPDLQDVTKGFDVAANDADTWNQDTVGHGSHCAGIIIGRDNGHGVRGFAPDAEFFVYKIFPGGRFSDLLDALDRCISDNVDVVNLSLGTAERSQIVEQKLARAKKMGIACFVAAGNDAGPVKFPALSPDVLAVGAVGKQGAFPAESYHATQVARGTKVTDDGFFSAKFSCFGPEIDVVAPGVGIISSVPDDRYAAWDGTSMASPHVVGLAALVLAHHPDFQKGKYALRSEERVDHLFERIRSSARRLDFGDPGRSGSGLPDARKALGLDGAGTPAAAAAPASAATNGGASATTGTTGTGGRNGHAAGLTAIRSLMEASGLLSSSGGVRPMSAPDPVVPVGGPPGAAVTLDQLTSLMQVAGLVIRGSATAKPHAEPDPLAPLSEMMSGAGLTPAGR